MNLIYEDMFKIMISNKKMIYMIWNTCTYAVKVLVFHSFILICYQKLVNIYRLYKSKKISLPKYRFALLCEIDAA